VRNGELPQAIVIGTLKSDAKPSEVESNLKNGKDCLPSITSGKCSGHISSSRPTGEPCRLCEAD
jgi:hypothetical protein